MGTSLHQREPASDAVLAFLGRVISTAGAKPKHLVCDQGPQFSSKNFKPWCLRKGIRPRFGAIGEHGSIAVIERLILTLKQSIAWLTLVPLRRPAFLRELRYLAAWYNSHRPDMTLGGRMPDEVYHRLRLPGGSGPASPGPSSGPPASATPRRPAGGVARRPMGRPARWRTGCG